MIMPLVFKPRDLTDCYWYIADDTTQVYSSASRTIVPSTDATFVTWMAKGNTPISISSVANLGTIIARNQLLPPVDVTVLDAYLSAKVDEIDLIQFRILFNHENRIRTLAGQASITADQFKAGIKALL